jgi:hypothetical protein
MFDWGREPSEQTQAADQKLMPIEPEKIVYISFYREGEFIECVNDHGQWMIHKPIVARADSSRINRILAKIEMLPRVETITQSQRQVRGLTLGEYGLVNPRLRIVLGDADKRRRILVGNNSPLKNAVYVQVDQGEDVVATSANILEMIPGSVADIRDTRLLRGSEAYVRRLEIKRANGPLLRLVQEGSEWIIQRPVVARADWVKVTRLLEQLFTLSIQLFVADEISDPVAYGLSDDEAILQIGVWQEDDKTGDRLVFGKRANEQGNAVYAMRRNSSTVVTVARDRVEALLAATADLRDPRLYFMAPEKMALIRIEEGERALELRKGADASWQIVEPNQGKADGRMVADLISRLNTLRVDLTIDSTNGAAMGLDRPAHVILVAEVDPVSMEATQGVGRVLTGPIEKQRRALLISPPQPGKEYVFAKFEDEAPIYRISASSSSTISLDPFSYRDGTVLALDSTAIRKITLKKDKIEQTVERAGDGVWKAASPAAGEANPAVVADLLAKAADLKVMRFEHGDIRDLAVYGLKNAGAALTFSLSGEEGIQKTLLFGENSEDLGVYAMFQGQDMVFVLEKPLVDMMIRDLIR